MSMLRSSNPKFHIAIDVAPMIHVAEFSKAIYVAEFAKAIYVAEFAKNFGYESPGVTVYRNSCRTPLRSWRISLQLALLFCLASFSSTWAVEPQMRIRLKDGSFGAGTIVGVDQPNQLGWKGSAFETPFRLDVRAIRSVTSAEEKADNGAEKAVKDAGSAEQLFELSSGGMVVGQLVSMDDEWLIVDSQILGQVKLARAAVTSIVDAGYAGQLVYSGPIDDDRWQRLTAAEDWEFEAGALVATKQGAAIVGNVALPPKSQINLSMSWRGTPDFVLSLGTLASNKVSKVEEVPSAARLEVWANQLALVREVDGGADIAMLSDLSDANPRIDLTIYLDQEAGTIVVCDSHGRPMETLSVPSEKAVTRPAVHLANSGPSLTIEHFEVRQWDGVAASVATEDQSVLDATGGNRKGAIVGYDPQTRLLKITLASGEQALLPLAQIRRGDVAAVVVAAPTTNEQTGESLPPAVVQPPQLDQEQTPPEATSPLQKPPAGDTKSPFAEATTEGEATASSIESADASESIEIILVDRTRLSGKLASTEDPRRLRFASKDLADEVSFDCQVVRSVIGTTERFVADDSEQVVGTLKVGDSQLVGYLEELSSHNPTIESCLWWHPSGSVNASPISLASAGAIIYRKALPLPAPEGNAAQAAAARNRAQVLAPAVGMFLGNRGNPKGNSQEVVPTEATVGSPEAREIMFRTGDAIDGVVERIDESGMTFRSAQTTTTKAPHELIQHVWLNRGRGTIETSPEKLKRLMTVPRSMKQDPPTHLFIAVNGDYLRGRLVQLEGDRLKIEVRLEMVEMSTAQVAQIIWLHDRDWSEKPAATDKAMPSTPGQDDTAKTVQATPPGPIEQFLVHAIGRTDRGLTFRPEQLSAGELSGHSDLLGRCSIAVKDLNQLLFGRNISEQVRAFREDPWTLSLAQTPRVYMEDGADSSAPAGENSPLVGKPAIDFTLKSLDGESFRLSKHRDRIVVLDFWASWCGPCVQTMPLVEAVVDELGTDKIHLVAVNIQETPARATAAVERLELNSTVLLDVDGQAAAAYAANAIPQTVIIDREGVITHVFVGGGPKFVEQFRQALQASVTGLPTE
jgi:thiol-disulfide isomerase/thioredoxin